MTLERKNESVRRAYQACPPNDICSFYPCHHSPCQDPDWTAHIKDQTENPELANEAFHCSIYPSHIKLIPPEIRPEIELRIQRLRKIERKMDEIVAEMRMFHRRKSEERKLKRRMAEEQKVAEFAARLDELNTGKNAVDEGNLE